MKYWLLPLLSYTIGLWIQTISILTQVQTVWTFDLSIYHSSIFSHPPSLFSHPPSLLSKPALNHPFPSSPLSLLFSPAQLPPPSPLCLHYHHTEANEGTSQPDWTAAVNSIQLSLTFTLPTPQALPPHCWQRPKKLQVSRWCLFTKVTDPWGAGQA
jgi:hypothetical protein